MILTDAGQSQFPIEDGEPTVNQFWFPKPPVKEHDQLMRFRTILASGMVLSGLAGVSVAGDMPASLELNASDLSTVDRVEMPPQNNLALKESVNRLNLPFIRFAEPLFVEHETWSHGTWETLSDGRQLWRLRILSKDAENLNLGFSEYLMPEGGELFLYTPDFKTIVGPFTHLDNQDHGELWTPVLDGDEIIIEVAMPGDEVSNFRLKLGQVSHGFLPWGGVVDATRSGSCNVDVVCPQGDDWRDQIRSSGAYTRGGLDTCSGSLVNNTAQDKKAYFLTAYHCGITEGNAGSVVVYWNYQNSTCRTPGSAASGQPGNGTRNQFNSGATLRMRYQPSDVCLIEMNTPINPAHDLYWSGWDATNSVPDSCVAIHHPGVEEKRISFENDPLSVTTYLQDATPGDGTHLRIADWDLGTTEGGSSGSPIYNSSKRIVGQLHGGFAACGNNDEDWYGWMFISWTGGGTAATRLRDWLDPLNLGVLTFDGRGESPLNLAPPVELDDSAGDNDGIVERGESGIAMVVPLNNSGTSSLTNVNATLATTTPGVTITQNVGSYGTIGAGSTVDNGADFVFDVGPEVLCGTPIAFSMTVSWDGDSNVISFAVPTGPNCDILPFFVKDGEPSIDDTTGTGNHNGIAEPGETILVWLPIRNTEGAASAVQGTLSSTKGGISVPTSNASYGAVASGASSTSMTPFMIAIAEDYTCGDPITLNLMLEADGEMNEAEYVIRHPGAEVLRNGFETGQEGFTAVATSGTGNWAVAADAAANSGTQLVRYNSVVTSVTEARLTSPPVENPVALRFHHVLGGEQGSGNTGYDGGVLEYTINGGASWQSVPAAWFQAGAYTHAFSTCCSNPRPSAPGWAGTIATMTEVRVDLTAIQNQTAQFRWVWISDASVTASLGWKVDDIVFEGIPECEPPFTDPTDKTHWVIF